MPTKRCPKCHGEGAYNYAVMPKYEPRLYSSAPDVLEETVSHERRTCEQCAGAGYIEAKTGDRVAIFLDGRKVGTCLNPPRIRPMPWVDQRPGDYVPKTVNGEMGYEANRMLGMGDIECLEGFIGVSGKTEGYEEQRRFLLDLFVGEHK